MESNKELPKVIPIVDKQRTLILDLLRQARECHERASLVTSTIIMSHDIDPSLPEAMYQLAPDARTLMLIETPIPPVETPVPPPVETPVPPPPEGEEEKKPDEVEV